MINRSDLPRLGDLGRPRLSQKKTPEDPKTRGGLPGGFWGPKMAKKWPKNGRPCNYINPYHPILAPPKKCKNVHFLGPKKGVIFTRALFTRLFYLYFWRTGGDIFGKGEKTAPRGHFSTFFPVLAGVMGLSTPILGGLKDGFFGPKITKNGHVLAHPYDPGIDPNFRP